jgi:histidinol-phosphate/aromatic aminotransferase/cobyric acid decarboxylase-like protein
MAMAGLRVGYLLSSPELVKEVHKATLPYNLNVFSATAAEVACRRYDLLKPQVEMIIQERERLFKMLAAIPDVEPVPSNANFMLVRTPLPPREIFEKLHRKDILVRDVSGYPMLARYFRVSVGTPAENDYLVEALGEIMAGR